jgi:hypothetical protein
MDRYKLHQGKPTEPTGRKAVIKNCQICGKQFEAKQRNRMYCSQACNQKASDDRRSAA